LSIVRIRKYDTTNESLSVCSLAFIIFALLPMALKHRLGLAHKPISFCDAFPQGPLTRLHLARLLFPTLSTLFVAGHSR
jgi:hypothetical protein